MRGEVYSFRLPKDGNSEAEYEDAHCVGPGAVDEGEITVPRVRIAVADGASESMLAGRWATELVRCFAKGDNLGPTDLLAEATGRWIRFVEDYRHDRQVWGRPIRWYEEPGLTRGAHATLLVLDVDGAGDEASAGDWSAFALGDTCLFQVRDGQLLDVFPVKAAADFSSTPPLVPSSLADPRLVTGRLQHHHGTWISGDYLYLATDALAAWLLGEHERSRQPWNDLRDLGTSLGPMGFSVWIQHLRDNGSMRNDDVTLIRFAIWG